MKPALAPTIRLASACLALAAACPLQAAETAPGWIRGEVRRYSSVHDQEGSPLGWTISAPATLMPFLVKNFNVGGLDKHRRAPLPQEQCQPWLELRAFKSGRLDPKKADARLPRLIADYTRSESGPLAAPVVRKTVHGRPAYIFTTWRKPGAEKGLLGRKSLHLALDLDGALLFLMYSFNYDDEARHDACLESYLDLYQDIAATLKPGAP